jgi:hypothetical protein
VGDPAGELADALHLLGLAELRFQVLALGHITAHHEEIEAPLPDHRRTMRLDPAP